MRLHKKTITLAEKGISMLETIKNHHGFASDSETIRFIITQHYNKLISPTRYGKAKTLDPVSDLDKSENICKSLEGEVIDGSCHYIKYDRINPHVVLKFETTKPLSNLSIKDITDQYIGGTKKEIHDTLIKMKQKEEEEEKIRNSDIYNIKPEPISDYNEHI